MKTLTLKVPLELDLRLASAAKHRGESKSALVREALEAYLADQKNAPPLSCYDLAKDIIGCFEGPGDLSTNPKYMDGFGE